MKKLDKNGKKTNVADFVTVYRPPGVKGRRFSDEEIGGAEILNYPPNFGRQMGHRYISQDIYINL